MAIVMMLASLAACGDAPDATSAPSHGNDRRTPTDHPGHERRDDRPRRNQ